MIQTPSVPTTFALDNNPSYGRLICAGSLPKRRSKPALSQALTATGSHQVGINLREHIKGNDAAHCAASLDHPATQEPRLLVLVAASSSAFVIPKTSPCGDLLKLDNGIWARAFPVDTTAPAALTDSISPTVPPTLSYTVAPASTSALVAGFAGVASGVACVAADAAGAESAGLLVLVGLG
jgi:hypothetical protein